MFTKDDFNSLYFKGVLELESSDFDKLKSMSVFDGIDFSNIHSQKLVKKVQYFVLMYDKGSPLIHKYSDINIRKDKAFETAGFDKYRAVKMMESLRHLEEENDVKVIAQMLKKQADHSLSFLISQEELFYELLNHVMEPISKEESDKDKMDALIKKSKLSEEMESISDRIEKYRARYFRGDTNLEKKIRRSFSYSPEGIANR